MDIEQQEKELNELKNTLTNLNNQFNEIMTQQDYTLKDIQIDENKLPKEVSNEWEKIKQTIKNNNQHTNIFEENTNTKNLLTRRNIIRL